MLLDVGGCEPTVFERNLADGEWHHVCLAYSCGSEHAAGQARLEVRGTNSASEPHTEVGACRWVVAYSCNPYG